MLRNFSVTEHYRANVRNTLIGRYRHQQSIGKVDQFQMWGGSGQGKTSFCESYTHCMASEGACYVHHNRHVTQHFGLPSNAYNVAANDNFTQTKECICYAHALETTDDCFVDHFRLYDNQGFNRGGIAMLKKLMRGRTPKIETRNGQPVMDGHEVALAGYTPANRACRRQGVIMLMSPDVTLETEWKYVAQVFQQMHNMGKRTILCINRLEELPTFRNAVVAQVLADLSPNHEHVQMVQEAANGWEQYLHAAVEVPQVGQTLVASPNLSTPVIQVFRNIRRCLREVAGMTPEQIARVEMYPVYCGRYSQHQLQKHTDYAKKFALLGEISTGHCFQAILTPTEMVIPADDPLLPGDVVDELCELFRPLNVEPYFAQAGMIVKREQAGGNNHSGDGDDDDDSL